MPNWNFWPYVSPYVSPIYLWQGSRNWVGSQTIGNYPEKANREGITARATNDVATAALWNQCEILTWKSDVSRWYLIQSVHQRGARSRAGKRHRNDGSRSGKRLTCDTEEDRNDSRINSIRRDSSVPEKHSVLQGWPELRKHVRPELHQYWNMRDEISVSDGLLLAGSRIIIPESMRTEILKTLHESHMGIEKTKSRASAVIFWPGISKDIEDIVSKCATCLRFKFENVKEPLIPHEIPDGPFRKVGMDILTFQGADFLVVVDYFSKYPELCRLTRGKSAGVVISHVKSVFTVVCDNMPFNSNQFLAFAREWGFQVTTSSPL